MLNYEQMIDTALLSVVRASLRHIEKEGLEGDHHFYLSFLTQYPGVQMPDHVKKVYPEEITIVLQHEFWNLKVEQDHLSVDVKFDDQVETVLVPFQAVSHVSDPAANFELEFNPKAGELKQFGDLSKVSPQEEKEDLASKEKTKGTVVSLDSFRKK
jgi:hypothetical protein